MIDSEIYWLGKMPKSWTIQPLKTILRERNVLNKKCEYEKVLSLTIANGVIPYEEKTGGGNKKKDDISKYKIVLQKDLVINSMNVVVGAAGISDYNGVVSPVYYSFEQINNVSNIRYYLYLFLTNTFQDYLFGLGNGILVKLNEENGKMNTIRKKIPINKLKESLVLLPPLKIQNKIASFLDNKCSIIDNEIEKNKKSIELMEEYRKAVVDDNVWKGKNTLQKMKYLVKSRDNKVSKDSTTFIGLENIESYSGKYICTNTKYDDSEAKEIKKGDLLISRLRPYLTKSLLAPFDGSCTGELVVIKEFSGKMKFLHYLTLSNRFIDLVDSSTYGTKMPRANWDFIKNIQIPVMESNKQQEIVYYLDNKCSLIDKVIEYRKGLIEKLEEYKKSLIYEAVTGKLEV